MNLNGTIQTKKLIIFFTQRLFYKAVKVVYIPQCYSLLNS